MKIVFIIVSILLLVWAFYLIKHYPQLFSKENFWRSANTLGWVALFLIGIIAFFVWLLREIA
jgi:positive regulator of sigma E activity